MFQSFAPQSSAAKAAERLSALRGAIMQHEFAGFLVPRADAWRGENVAPGDERLAWLTGFTGSAGLCAVLAARAGIFIDGRYRLAVRDQVDLDLFEPVPVPEVALADWLAAALPSGGVLGFDPWLHGKDEISKLSEALARHGIILQRSENLVDLIWKDKPAPPVGPVSVHLPEYSGESHAGKRARLAQTLGKDGQKAAILTSAESLAWLLNIRGSDVARVPVPHGFGILHADARVTLFIEPAKLGPDIRAHLGNEIDLAAPEAFGTALDHLAGPVTLDPQSAPLWVSDRLEAAGVAVIAAPDPCILPRARKNATELRGTRAAHLRDGAALANFLCWLAGEAPNGDLTEIDVVTRLEAFRAETGLLRDLSFDSICGSGPNGAIVHYRVSEATSRRIAPGDVLLVDSGGQYADGTTDVTRTMAVGKVNRPAARAFTLVLKGLIAISRARWPVGLTGRDLDGFARQALWQAGMDYDHGTGHGVGSYLGVHEGPQGISRRTLAVLEPGMIISNEPGYYRDGAFGIRIENLVVVEPATVPQHGDRPMHSFETLTLAPIDRAMIVRDLLDPAETVWLNAYHRRVRNALTPLVPRATADWLARACAPL